MTSEIYNPKERFRDFNFWEQQLIYLWPWEIEELYVDVNEHNDPIITEITFWLAMHKCCLNHGYFNKYLNDEQQQLSFKFADHIERGIRKIWHDNNDIIDRFEEASKTMNEYGGTYGAKTIVHEVLDGEPDEFNEIMKVRIEQDQIKKGIKLNKENKI